MRGEIVGSPTSPSVVVDLTAAELLLLSNAMNEALEAVEDWEFPHRVGAEKAEALALKASLDALIRRIPTM